MSLITVSWDNDTRTIIRWEFQTGWYWADLYQARGAFDQLMEAVSHPVDVIINLNKTTIPLGDTLHNFRAVSLRPPTHRRVMVLTNASTFGLTVAEIVRHTFRIWDRMLIANSLEEAYAKIAAYKSQPIIIAELPVDLPN